MMIKGSFELLPPAPGLCQECAIDHKETEPHDKNSFFYQVKFFLENGRNPTWADALAHCTPELQKAWKKELKLRDAWSE